GRLSYHPVCARIRRLRGLSLSAHPPLLGKEGTSSSPYDYVAVVEPPHKTPKPAQKYGCWYLFRTSAVADFKASRASRRLTALWNRTPKPRATSSRMSQSAETIVLAPDR